MENKVSDSILEIVANLEDEDEGDGSIYVDKENNLAEDVSLAGLSADLLSTRAELAALQDKVRWVPVTDQLPGDYLLVLFYDSINGEILLGSHVKQFSQWTSSMGMFYHDANYGWITSWMPLPSSPIPAEGENG